MVPTPLPWIGDPGALFNTSDRGPGSHHLPSLAAPPEPEVRESMVAAPAIEFMTAQAPSWLSFPGRCPSTPETPLLMGARNASA